MKKIMIICLLVLFGCSTTSDAIDTNKVPEDFDRPDFERTASFYDDESGWNYSLTIHYPDKKTNEIDNVFFSGVNLKYIGLDGFNKVNVVDEEGNVIDSINRTVPTLQSNELYNSELSIIHDFLTEKKFNRTITESDIEDISITIISKGQLVDLYNEAINLPVRKLGKFKAVPYSNCSQTKLDNTDVVQVCYDSNYGDIGKINIEYIYGDDGNMLSDKVKRGVANEDEILYQHQLNELEVEIENKQNYDISIGINLTDDFDVKLSELLSELFEPKEDS